MKKRRNWLLILFGVAVLVVFVGIGVVIALAAWFQQNLQRQETSAADAQVQFSEVRQQFGGRPALLDMRDGRPVYNTVRTASPQPSELQSLHVLVWDSNDQQLARLSIPFWVLRLKSGPIEFSSYASGLGDGGVNLRPEDIEKYGAGIILDTTSHSGDHILLWAR